MWLAASGAPNAEERLKRWCAVVLSSDDAQEGAEVFLKKREPHWQGC